MAEVFEELFRVWCPPYDLEKVPEHLRKDSVRSYAQHAFEKGFKLAMQLAVISLEPNALQDL